MTVPSSRLPAAEALLADHDWARRLARRLVEDPALAEDLAQEAWVRVLESPPRSSWPLRSWLGGVLRNLARETRRGEKRREARQKAVARPEALDSAVEALTALQCQQDVVRAVLALEEPYRSTVVLRFYADLPPRTIAKQCGVPLATVKTRLTRGLAQLRGRLDREHGGDGRSWALFLLPLAGRGRGIVPWITGALALNTLSKIGIVAAAAVVVVWVAQRENLPRAAALETARTEAPAKLLAPPEERAPVRPPSAERVELPVVAPALAPAAPAPVEEGIDGVVVDIRGLPLAGVALALRGSNGVRFGNNELAGHALWNQPLPTTEPLGWSGADGRFHLSLSKDVSQLVVSQDERWETVMAPVAMTSTDAVLVVAERFRLTGTVRDPDGAPLAGVQLAFGVPEGHVRLPAGLSLGNTRSNGWEAVSDAAGRFAFERLPAIPGARLLASLEPYETARMERQEWSEGELEIVLREPAGGWLEGRVEADGKPLAGAEVVLGYRAIQSGADGGFRLSLAGLEKESELSAISANRLPARLTGDRNADGTVRWPSFVRLVLEGEPLALAGTVLDTDGAPLAGQELWLVDPSVGYVGSGFPVLLESLLIGKNDMRHGTKTDAQGRFLLEGLEPRDYQLQVVDPKTAVVFQAGPFGAGDENLVLRRPEGVTWPRLRGRVLSRSGQPIADASVSIERQLGLVLIPGTHNGFGFQTYGARATTGDDGRFELTNVPREEAILHVGGAGLADPELELEAELDPEDLKVTVARRVQVQVELGSDREATAFALLDAAGNLLQMSTAIGGGVSQSNSMPIQDGRSPVVTSSDEAVTLVLYHDAKELQRVPVALHAEGLNSIDL